MGGLEAGLVALVILFYIIRAIFRGVRAVIQGLRRAMAPRPVRQVEQVPPTQASQQVTAARPPREALRSEAVGPAVAEAVAYLPPITSTDDGNMASPEAPRLLGGPDDLLRAVIWQEVLAQPLSQRRRAPQPMHAPTLPPQ